MVDNKIMKRSLTLFLATLLIGKLSAQVPEQIYFIAGMPIRQCVHDGTGEVFVSQILKYSKEGEFTNKLTISDSTEILFSLNYYPKEKKIVSLSCLKSRENSPVANAGYKLSTVDVNDLSKEEIVLDQYLTISEAEYYVYNKSLRPIKLNGNFFSSIEYHSDDAKIFSRRFIVSDSLKTEIGYSELQNTIPNGSMAGPLFRSNGDLLALEGHSNKRLLVIPSYLKEDSIFHTVIPEDAVLAPNRYSAVVLINNEQIRLIFYREGKNGSAFYNLYNKEQNRYYQYPFDDSNLNVKQFDNWIAGPTRIKYEKYSYKGPQPGQDQWNPNDNKYGLSVAEYIDRKLKTMILSGYLAIRSIHDPSIFIEWDTKQGDSEILGIHQDIVYYRKHDEVWYVPIVQGKQLGQHEMLLKNEAVPGIHFMFVRE